MDTQSKPKQTWREKERFLFGRMWYWQHRLIRTNSPVARAVIERCGYEYGKHIAFGR